MTQYFAVLTAFLWAMMEGDIAHIYDQMSLTRNTLYLSFSLLLLGITMNAICPKRWSVSDPLL